MKHAAQTHNNKIDKQVLYYQALQMAYDAFIEEEKKGWISAELRLMEAIEAARILYKH